METRQKTNSITHLVKIVAEEVFHDLMKKRPQQTPREFLDLIQSDLEMAGQKWSKAEDQMLIDEVRVAVATIAKNHQRTIGAIVARVQDQSIINCDSIQS